MQAVPNKTDKRLSMNQYVPHYTVFLYSFSHHASDLSDYGHDAHLYIKARGSGADIDAAAKTVCNGCRDCYIMFRVHVVLSIVESPGSQL